MSLNLFKSSGIMAGGIMWERASVSQKLKCSLLERLWPRGYDKKEKLVIQCDDMRFKAEGHQKEGGNVVWKWQLIPVRLCNCIWGVLVSTKGNNVFRRGLEWIFQSLLYIQVAIFNCLPLILKIVKLKLTPSFQVSTCSLQVTMFSSIYLCIDFH